MNFTKDQNETFFRLAAQKVPLNKTIAQAKDIAASLLFLSSEDSSIITGEILTVDGGQSLAPNNYDEYVKAALNIKFEVGNI
jgi:enoyl-[acyl-carrier-protein] reductase (NADH)